MPITHEWNGTILTITSDSGTSSADLKGQKGDDGARGAQGVAGSAIAEDTAKLGGIVADEYATKAYVDTAVSNADIDLTNYATKDYVDTAVDNVDLSNYYNKTEVDSTVSDINRNMEYYATKDYVDNAVENADVDLTDYATKTYVDNAVANVEVDLTDYATKTYVEEAVSGLGSSSSVAYNLLDNSDFRNPINQRGETTYNSSTYSIDRWYLYVSDSDSGLTVNDGYITLTAHMYQKLTNVKADVVYTLAVKQRNGELVVVSHTFPATGDGLSPINFYYTNDMATIRLGAGEYEWVALYEGEYTAETLPPYIPKGYTAELLECQRYFYPLNPQSICFGSTNASKSAFYGDVFTPAPMIKAPTVQSANNNYYLTNNGSQVAVNNTLSVNTIVGNKVQLFIRIDNLGMNASIVAKMWADTNNTYIYLNSEL